MCGRERLIRDSELVASRTELAKVQGAEEELKKKVASLEEALKKANNDLESLRFVVKNIRRQRKSI